LDINCFKKITAKTGNFFTFITSISYFGEVEVKVKVEEKKKRG
jgi:hypothetical protein